MPRTAKPSGACQNCKNLHVKCDEVRPACGRCVRSNRICPGYAEGLDLVLRDQNQATKAVVSRRQNASNRKLRRHPGVALLDPSRPASEESSEGSQSPELSAASVIPRSLVESEDIQARSFFVSNYVLVSRDPQTDRGFIELLPFLFSDLRAESPVSLALTAVSRCMFGAWERKNRDTETSDVRAAFVKAVAATRDAVQDPKESLEDETLMAVCLLGLYESVTEAFRNRLSSARHFYGAAAMIENRGIQNIKSELSKRLLLAIRSHIVSRAVSYCSPIDTSSEIWRDPDQLPQNPATLLDDFSVEIANILCAANQALSMIVDLDKVQDENSLTVGNLLVRAKTAEARLARWPEAVPPSWIPVRVPRSSIPQTVINAGLYGDYCEVFPDVIICGTWNSWRTTRLKILSLIARLDPDKSGAQALAVMQQLADDICATVPFILGSRMESVSFHDDTATYPWLEGQSSLPKGHARAAVGLGGWSLWTPLKEIINVIMYLRPGYRDWIREQLLRLARIYDVSPH